MQNLTPQEDLLPEDNFRPIIDRSQLLPGLFKAGLAFLMLLYAKELTGYFGIGKFLFKMEGPQFMVMLTIIGLRVFSALATIVICGMFFMHSDYAAKAGIPVLIGALILGGLSVAAEVAAGNSNPVSMFFSILGLVVLLLSIIHAFRIRKQWAEAIVVR